MLGFLRRSVSFDPVPFGPEWTPASARHGRAEAVEVRSGPLAGKTLNLKVEMTPLKADIALQDPDGSEVTAHCHFDRDPETGAETLWDIFVHPSCRNVGLASLMVRLSFRMMLENGRRHWFGVRKLMKVDTRRAELHNIGIGIVCLKLGFVPEEDLGQLLSPHNIKAVDILLPTEGSPPGLRITLNRLPGVVVAGYISTETRRPETDLAVYRRFFSPQRLAHRARQGAAVVGNIDYGLAPGNIDRFCRHLADDASEFSIFRKTLRAGARRLGLKPDNGPRHTN